MLVPAVLMNIPNSNVCLKGESSIEGCVTPESITVVKVFVMQRSIKLPDVSVTLVGSFQ